MKEDEVVMGLGGGGVKVRWEGRKGGRSISVVTCSGRREDTDYGRGLNGQRRKRLRPNED